MLSVSSLSSSLTRRALVASFSWPWHDRAGRHQHIPRLTRLRLAWCVQHSRGAILMNDSTVPQSHLDSFVFLAVLVLSPPPWHNNHCRQHQQSSTHGNVTLKKDEEAFRQDFNVALAQLEGLAVGGTRVRTRESISSIKGPAEVTVSPNSLKATKCRANEWDYGLQLKLLCCESFSDSLITVRSALPMWGAVLQNGGQ